MPEYRRAVENATFAVVDSSLLVLLWFFRKGEILGRISGLQYMRGLSTDSEFRRKDATFWVMPSSEDMVANLAWLKSQRITVTPGHCYLAPLYPKGAIQDRVLLAQIEASRPRYIVINIAGGTQEILGGRLISKIYYRPTIVCTGAAIAFLSGRQASIHPWVDKLMLAWLARCFHEPTKFVPRYLGGFRLIQVMFRHAERPVSLASK